MLGQQYKVVMSPENMLEVRPTQFVFESNESDVITGFVSEVDDLSNYVQFTLFEPKELGDYAHEIVEGLDEKEVEFWLYLALEQNPEMKAEWELYIAPLH